MLEQPLYKLAEKVFPGATAIPVIQYTTRGLVQAYILLVIMEKTQLHSLVCKPFSYNIVEKF